MCGYWHACSSKRAECAALSLCCLNCSAATTSNRSAAVFIGDAYEDHFLLPGDFVMLITTQRLILLEAPDFVALQLRVMSGELAHVTEVPGGVVVWELRYKSMLTAELAWHQQIPGVPPDGVLVHRKARSQRDGMLVYDVRCSACKARNAGQEGTGRGCKLIGVNDYLENQHLPASCSQLVASFSHLCCAPHSASGPGDAAGHQCAKEG
eukprot:1158533-Pelagomonas_calceolata.AAC.3